MPLLTVPANDIDVPGIALDVSLPVDWLTGELADAQVSAVAPGHLTARLSGSGGDVIVRGRVQAKVTTPCARCLGPTEIPIDTELSLLLRPVPRTGPSGARGGPSHHAPTHGAHGANGANGAGARKGAQEKDKEPEYEFSSEEAEIDTYDGETVVLDPFVREAILLEMPNFPLCSEACPGIRPSGSEEAAAEPVPPLDPRLAPLGALRDKLARGARRTSEPPSADKGDQGQPAPTKSTKKKKKE